MNSELTLAEGCRRGDNTARKQLYETYASYLLGVSLRYVGDRSVAEDLLHDGFIQILTHFDQFCWKGEGSLRAWLFKVQQNVILSHIRKKEKLQETVWLEENPQVQDIEEPPGIEDIPKRVIMQMIAELPAGYRTIFNMYVIDELPHREIARLLGIQEHTSASQLLRARRLLAIKINKWRNENL